MSREKLSSDKVPEKFVEWLLAMGCPSEKVPSEEKIVEMCRGQYYMVWRSLMEHAKPRNCIRQKRLQVFYDDVKKFQKKSNFNKFDASVVVPEEISVWRQLADLKKKIADVEDSVLQSRHTMKQLLDKVSSKLSLRDSARRRVEAAQRRLWLLQQVAEELRTKRANLLETRTIADSLCCMEENGDIESKLEKCLSMWSQQWTRTNAHSSGSLTDANPVAFPSISSTNSEHDVEEHLLALVKYNSEALWQQLTKRRASLADALSMERVEQKAAVNARVNPQWVLTHTAALQSLLALDVIKNQVHIKQTQNHLTAAVKELNKRITGDECELLVLHCESARTKTEVRVLRTLLQEMTSCEGVFSAAGHPGGENNSTVKQIAAIDRAIESKRDELKRVRESLAVTERKIQSVRDCLITVFNLFHDNASSHQHDRFIGQLSLPQDSILTLRQYYEKRRERVKQKTELNLLPDVSSDYLITDPIENSNLTYIDELKIYLKNFNLEMNRQLVLESGEKVWIFQTIRSCFERLLTEWQTGDIKCLLVCPSASVVHNLQRLALEVQTREELEAKARELDNMQRRDVVIDITSTKEQEQEITDKIKKRLHENLLSLQITKSLELSCENLTFWADSNIRQYISSSRTIQGKTYSEFEAYYLYKISSQTSP